MFFGPSILGAGTETLLESRITMFTPHCICRPRTGDNSRQWEDEPQARPYWNTICECMPPSASACRGRFIGCRYLHLRVRMLFSCLCVLATRFSIRERLAATVPNSVSRSVLWLSAMENFTLQARELKSRLDNYGIEYHGINEKQDLVKLLEDAAQQKARNQKPGSAKKPRNLLDEQNRKRQKQSAAPATPPSQNAQGSQGSQGDIPRQQKDGKILPDVKTFIVEAVCAFFETMPSSDASTDSAGICDYLERDNHPHFPASCDKSRASIQDWKNLKRAIDENWFPRYSMEEGKTNVRKVFDKRQREWESHGLTIRFEATAAKSGKRHLRRIRDLPVSF